MRLGLGLGLTTFPRRGGTPAFSPSTLFASSEPGVWYDPSDLTTLFTDTAGTTPVTTPGQTVALMLDKSKGLVLGTELVTNGDFSGGTTGWSERTTAPDAAISNVSGRLRVTATTGGVPWAFTSFTTEVGKTYQISISDFGGTAPKSDYKIGTAQNSSASGIGTISATTSPGTVNRVFIATATTTFITLEPGLSAYNSSAIGQYRDYDNISVRELPGNHATQATAASRPTYGVVPLGGRRNLLTWSEGFDNAAWTKLTGVSVPTTNGAAPDGTLTADTVTSTSGNQIEQTGVTTVNGATYATSAWIKKTIGATVFPMLCFNSSTVFGQVILNTNTGAASVRSGLAGATNVVVVDAVDYWRLSFATVAGTTSSQVLFYPAASTNGTSYSAGLSGSQVVWGAQIELGSTATAYQRVSTAFDVTEAGVQSCAYLSFDGVDDSMVTPTITPGVDKVQAFAGVRKLSDVSAGIIAELSATAEANSGSLVIFRNTNRYGAKSRGSINTTQIDSANTFASPISNVLTSLGNIAGDLATLRVNGIQESQSTADQGTGNFLAYPLYIGRRGGVELPFNGQIYSLIARFGANLDTTAITNTETWVAGKTGVTL